MFDFYAEWLQISQADGPPDHYGLLGLPRFEDDPEVIRAAYWDRFETVRLYEVGTYSEPALQLLAELSLAFQCLTNADSKRQYDNQLRQDEAADYAWWETVAEDPKGHSATETTSDDLDFPEGWKHPSKPDAEENVRADQKRDADQIDVVAAELVEEIERAAAGESQPGAVSALRSRLRNLLEATTDSKKHLAPHGWNRHKPSHPARHAAPPLNRDPPGSAPAPSAHPTAPPVGSRLNVGVSLRRRVPAHRGGPLALAWSPGGDFLATAGADGRVRIWDAESGEHLHDAAVATPSCDALQWSPDSRWLLSRDGRQIGGVWDIAERTAPEVFAGLAGQNWPAAWNPVSGHLAFARDEALCLAQPPATNLTLPANSAAGVSTFAFAPDGVHVVIGFEMFEPSRRRYGVRVQPLIRFLVPDDSQGVSVETPGPVEYLEVRAEPSSSTLRFAARLEQQLLVYRLDGATVRKEAALDLPFFDGGSDLTFSWSSDGLRLACVADAAVSLWEFGAARASAPAVLPLNSAYRPHLVAFAPDNRHLAIGRVAGISIWSCAAQRESFSIEAKSPVVRIAWRADARRLALLHADGDLSLWDLPPLAWQAPPAPAGEGVAANLDLLRICVAMGAWDEYHAGRRNLATLSLTNHEAKQLAAIERTVKTKADRVLKAALDVKRKYAATNPGYYQRQLKAVVAMDRGVEHPYAQKLLEESIKRRGDRSSDSARA